MSAAESFAFNVAVLGVADQSLDLVGDTLKLVPVTATYVASRDTTVIDAGGGSDILDAEISVTGYTGGWGGSGRKTVAGTKSLTVDHDNDSVDFETTTITYDWGALGSGATIVAVVVAKEGGSDDTTSIPVAYLRIPSFTTDGSTSFVFTFNTLGILKLLTAGRVVQTFV